MKILAHPWLKEGTEDSKRSTKRKKTNQNNTNRSLSVRKSKKDEHALTKKNKRLTETCDNFRNELLDTFNSQSKVNTKTLKKLYKGSDNYLVEKKMASMR